MLSKPAIGSQQLDLQLVLDETLEMNNVPPRISGISICQASGFASRCGLVCITYLYNFSV